MSLFRRAGSGIVNFGIIDSVKGIPQFLANDKADTEYSLAKLRAMQAKGVEPTFEDSFRFYQEAKKKREKLAKNKQASFGVIEGIKGFVKTNQDDNKDMKTAIAKLNLTKDKSKVDYVTLAKEFEKAKKKRIAMEAKKSKM